MLLGNACLQDAPVLFASPSFASGRSPSGLIRLHRYDRQAIFTGSATVVDGKPFIVYPGLCTKDEFAGCITGTNYAQARRGVSRAGRWKACRRANPPFAPSRKAVPANASDPLYTNWTKDRAPGIDIAVNPIVNGTSDDPSTAWRTVHGEWRLIGNAKAHGLSAAAAAMLWPFSPSTPRRGPFASEAADEAAVPIRDPPK